MQQQQLCICLWISTGKIDVFLDFLARSTGGGVYRRVFISDDIGTNWKMILELSGASSNLQPSCV